MKNNHLLPMPFVKYQFYAIIYDVAGNTTPIGSSASPAKKFPTNVQKVTGITINQSNQTKNIRDTVTVSATITPSDANEQGVTWSTSAPSVASISTTETQSGTSITVKALSAGKSTITATAKGDISKTTSFILEVRNPITSVSLNKSTIGIAINGTTTLTATTTPSNADANLLTWTTSDSSIAAISVNEKTVTVTGKAKGTATITVQAKDDSSIKATCKVNVGITLAQQVAANPTSYIGKKVSNYSVNGESNWKIFYSDGTNTFLILADYLTAAKAKTCNSTITQGTGTYGVYWSSLVTTTTSLPYLTSFSPVSGSRERWTDYSTYGNGKTLATLLDTNKWTSFVNTTLADVAIGTPTVNMWMESWNVFHPRDVLDYVKLSSENDGYGVTITGGSSPSCCHPIKSLASYTNEVEGSVFFPHKSEWNSCQGYWLASPGYAGTGTGALAVRADGAYFGDDSCTNTLIERSYFSLRPVVRLKSTVITTSNSADSTISIAN